MTAIHPATNTPPLSDEMFAGMDDMGGLSFVDTRARSTDSDTSHRAAAHAVSRKADLERAAILASIRAHGPSTAREVAADTGIDYVETQRRISEVAFIRKTEETRDGCKVWEAV